MRVAHDPEALSSVALLLRDASAQATTLQHMADHCSSHIARGCLHHMTWSVRLRNRRLQALKAAGGLAVNGLVAPAAAPAAASSDDQALVERIQAGVGMCMPLVAQPLLPPSCAQAVGWLPEQREQLASLLSRHAQLLLAGLAAVTAAGRAPAFVRQPGAAPGEQPPRPEQSAGQGVGGEPAEDPEEAAAVLLRLCACEPGNGAQSDAERRARQVAILAAGVVAQAAGQQTAAAGGADAAAADLQRRWATGRDGRARAANAMHRMLVALQVLAELVRLPCVCA